MKNKLIKIMEEKNMKKIILLTVTTLLFGCGYNKISEEQKYTYNVSITTSIYTYPQLTSENPYVINDIKTFEDYSSSQIRMMINGLNSKDTSEVSFENSERKGIKIQIRNCQIIDSIK